MAAFWKLVKDSRQTSSVKTSVLYTHFCRLSKRSKNHNSNFFGGSFSKRYNIEALLKFKKKENQTIALTTYTWHFSRYFKVNMWNNCFQRIILLEWMTLYKIEQPLHCMKLQENQRDKDEKHAGMWIKKILICKV